MKKSSFISGLVFGIIFLILSIFLFTLKGDSSIILIVAIADLIFGLSLVIGGIIGNKKSGFSENTPEINEPQTGFLPKSNTPDGSDFFGSPVHEEPAAAAVPQPESAQTFADNNGFVPDTEDIDFSSMSSDQIKAEELRLRAESRRSSQEAREAVAEAKQAIERENQAEAELARAEEAMRELTGAQRQDALREIDRLEQQALYYSQAAAAAKQKARTLSDQAQHAALQHSRAVDAAASFMDDDF